MSVPTGSWVGAAPRIAAVVAVMNEVTLRWFSSIARCCSSVTFARQTFAASLNALTLAAYSLHSSLFTGSFGVVGAAGSSGVGARFTWLNGRKISLVSFELWLIQAPTRASPGRRSSFGSAAATVSRAVRGSCGHGYDGDRFESPVYARSMRTA